MATTPAEAIDAIIQRAAEDGGVFVPRLFIQLCGNDHAIAMMLSQVLYWSKRTSDPEGWFYKEAKDWYREIGLSKHQSLKGNKLLRDLGIEVRPKQINGKPVSHYKVDPQQLEFRLLQFLESSKNGKTEGEADEGTKVENFDFGNSTFSTLESSKNGKTKVENFDLPNKETKTTNKDYMHDPSALRANASAEEEQASQTELPIDTPEQPNAKQTKTRKPKEPKDMSEHQKLMDAYQEALGYQIPNGGQEGIAAKWLIEHGYTVEQAIACYKHIKRDPYWSERHVSLQVVKREIGAYIASQKQAQARASPPIGPPALPFAENVLSKEQMAERAKAYLNGNGLRNDDTT